MTLSDFKDWQSHPITKAFFIAVSNKIEGLKQELSYQAGETPRFDSMKVGAIQALRDLNDADFLEETQA
jgi:hypothetical protein